MPRDRIDESMLLKDLGKFRKEEGIIGGVDDEIVDKGCCVESTQILAEQTEALSPYRPVLCSSRRAFCDLRRDGQIGERILRVAGGGGGLPFLILPQTLPENPARD